MSELIDNRAERIRRLKEVVRGLHEGQDPDRVKGRLEELVRHCDAGEIAAMEQALMAEGVPVQEIMGMCDLHSQVVRELLVRRTSEAIPPGHPVDVFRRENEALEATAAELRRALSRLSAGPEEARVDPGKLAECRQVFGRLMDVDKHYARKENLLFPVLERYGITGPSKVMWGKDDEVRELLRGLGESFGGAEATAGEWRVVVETVAGPALDALEEMVRKEEHILLPMALDTLSRADWAEIWEQSPEIGWCLVEPGEDYRPPVREDAELPREVAARADQQGVALHLIRPASRGEEPATGKVIFPTGSLDLDQIRAIFRTLPVDVTFVDAEDRVRYFSDGPARIFVRPKTVIGRKVQHCHPPASVDVVERILDDFRAGRQDAAEFWIELRGRFVHIRYFALRDEGGRYLGTLEVTQDLTHERALRGERRLLQYDESVGDEPRA